MLLYMNSYIKLLMFRHVDKLVMGLVLHPVKIVGHFKTHGDGRLGGYP